MNSLKYPSISDWAPAAMETAAAAETLTDPSAKIASSATAKHRATAATGCTRKAPATSAAESVNEGNPAVAEECSAAADADATPMAAAASAAAAAAEEGCSTSEKQLMRLNSGENACKQRSVTRQPHAPSGTAEVETKAAVDRRKTRLQRAPGYSVEAR